MKKKLLIVFFILLFLFTTCVYATNNVEVVNSDVFKAEEKTYVLDAQVSGNAFITANEFEMLDTATIEGNLYLVCDTAKLKSDVTYSNAISQDGSSSIESVNSHSSINGNVFVVCEEFILEPGAEINGDLYIVADKIDIQKSASIYGNLFAVSSEILLNGRVGNSVYATSEDFTMSYYGSISKDLNLFSEDVNLSSVIHRNANISSETITTSSDFILYGNLDSNSHKFNFSGEIDGNAKINSIELNFVNTSGNDDTKCLISGDLEYSSKKELQISDSIVKGNVTYSEYVEKIDSKPTFSFKDFLISLVTFVAYVLIVVLIFNLINKGYKDINHDITVKNVLLCLGLGILSFLAVITVSILLIITLFGLTLSFVLIFAYLFLLFMAIPIFILDIAILLKDKFNLYLATGLIALALYVISSIPFIGSFVMFVVLMTGVGRICSKVLFKKL